MEILKPRRNIGIILILLGSLIILIGSITPWVYDLFGEAHSLLNNPVAFLVWIAVLLIVVILSIDPRFIERGKIKRGVSIFLFDPRNSICVDRDGFCNCDYSSNYRQ